MSFRRKRSRFLGFEGGGDTYLKRRKGARAGSRPPLLRCKKKTEEEKRMKDSLKAMSVIRNCAAPTEPTITGTVTTVKGGGD
jgi:hypothetical protein